MAEEKQIKLGPKGKLIAGAVVALIALAAAYFPAFEPIRDMVSSMLIEAPEVATSTNAAQ